MLTLVIEVSVDPGNRILRGTFIMINIECNNLHGRLLFERESLYLWIVV